MEVPHSVVAAAFRALAKYIGDGFWEEDDWFTLNSEWDLNVVLEEEDDLSLVKAVIYNTHDRQEWMQVAEFSVDFDTEDERPVIVSGIGG